MSQPTFTSKIISSNVTRVVVPTKRNKDWEQWFLLRSDAHHDNPKCNQALELEHLNQAIERNAGIIDGGDLFCAMQGKYDKRSSKEDVRPEHQTSHYLDSLVDTAADFYAPFAGNFITIGRGNHETAISKNHETDLTDRLVGVLNNRTGSHIHATGYTFWIQFRFEHGKRGSDTQNLWGTHGYGGGGPVTQDTIQANRQQVYIENANIMMSGHVHRSWSQEFVRHRLNNAGNIERIVGTYVKTPTYKDDYGDGVHGYAVEKGHGPRPLGAYWLRFYWHNKSGQVRHEVIRAR